MSPETIFSIANVIALLAWLLLVVSPRRRWVTGVVTGRVVPALFAILYIGIIASMFGRTAGSFSTLAGVSALFANPWLLLAGWVHYLAFDLLVGTWEVRNAQESGIPHLVVVPCLFLTFMFGPAGWVVYMTLRSVLGRHARVS
jgi:hypothetical protein